jgi:hypothetical protein
MIEAMASAGGIQAASRKGLKGETAAALITW